MNIESVLYDNGEVFQQKDNPTRWCRLSIARLTNNCVGHQSEGVNNDSGLVHPILVHEEEMPLGACGHDLRESLKRARPVGSSAVGIAGIPVGCGP